MRTMAGKIKIYGTTNLKDFFSFKLIYLSKIVVVLHNFTAGWYASSSEFFCQNTPFLVSRISIRKFENIQATYPREH